MKSKIVVIASLLAASAALFTGSAMAGGVHWSVNVGVPAYPVVPAAPLAPVLAPMPPTVVYAPPPAVVYAPPPQPYYRPGVAVVQYGPPAYYGPPRPYWRHPHHPHPRYGRWD